MGVSVSHPLGRTAKSKYIQTVDYRDSSDENDNFLNQSLRAENSVGNTSRGRGDSTKRRNDPVYFQFKTTKSNPRDRFDSLGTIDSRKSVPFAVLPEKNIQLASTGSAAGEGGHTSVKSGDEAIRQKETGGTLFLGDGDGGNPAQECAGELTENHMRRTIESADGRVIPPLQQKLQPNDCVSSSTKAVAEVQCTKQSEHVSGLDTETCCGPRNEGISADVFRPSSHRDYADGREAERESEPVTMRVRADSEVGMVYPTNRLNMNHKHSI